MGCCASAPLEVEDEHERQEREEAHEALRAIKPQLSFLVSASRQQFGFFSEVQGEVHEKGDEWVSQAIARYHAFMHLRVQTGEQLESTIDIEFVWRTHLTYATDYTRSCKKASGRLIDHNLSDYDDRGPLTPDSDTAEAWENAYSTSYFDSSRLPACAKFTRMDLRTAVKHALNFYERIILVDHIQEQLESVALDRYVKFLTLIRAQTLAVKKFNETAEAGVAYPTDKLIEWVPPLDIDLLWQTHMQYPEQFARHCRELVYLPAGTLTTRNPLLYDPDNDQLTDEFLPLRKQWEKTTVMWYRIYGSSSPYELRPAYGL